MKLKEITDMLERDFPLSFAVSWDNSGLQVGDYRHEVGTVLLAVDATTDIIELGKQVKADLILTHHPLLFNGIKKVTSDDFVGRRILDLAQNGTACYAMHTNFDILAMADAAAGRLGLTDGRVLEVTYTDKEGGLKGLGKIGTLPGSRSLRDLADRCKDAFGIEHVRVYGDPDLPVKTCAILPGSGHDEIDLALRQGADVMITGDITHHVGIDSIEKGIAVIDAGHYGVEKLFVPYMKKYLERKLPDLIVLRAPVREPYTEI